MTETRPPPKLILSAEDNPDHALFIARALAHHFPGVKLVQVADGEQLLAHLADEGRSCPDLVMLDVNMPRLSGLDVLASLRRDPRLVGVPVVMFSTSHQDADVSRAYGLGANSYVTKPTSFREFLERMRELGVYWLNINEGSS